MTAMIMNSPATLCAPMPRRDFWQHSLAATLALALHAGVLALLINTWSPSAPEVKPPRVLTTQLVMVAPRSSRLRLNQRRLRLPSRLSRRRSNR